MGKKVYLSPERRIAPHGKYWGMELYEHDLCGDIAQKTGAALTKAGFQVKVQDDPALTMEARVAEAVKWGADCYLPIHTNASTNGTKEGTARGPLVLAYNHPTSLAACKAVYEALLEIYPEKSKGRGVQINSTFYEIIRTPMLSVYPEIAFHDNGVDAKWLSQNRQAIAEALCKGLCNYYGVQQGNEPAQDLLQELERERALRALAEEKLARIQQILD